MPDYTPTKRCTKCGKEYPATMEYFHKNAALRDGLSIYCKSCGREIARQSSQLHKERRNTYNKLWRENNREKDKERHRKWRANNQEKVTKQRNRWRAENGERSRELNKKWYSENREKAKIKNHIRRAKKRQLPHTLTEQELAGCLTYWRSCCAYCGESLDQLSMFVEKRKHHDHFIPLSDPRSDNPGTVVGNILPACISCNDSKRNRDPIEWVTWKFGAQKSKKILRRIADYFDLVKQPK